MNDSIERAIRVGVATARLSPVGARRVVEHYGGWREAAGSVGSAEFPAPWRDVFSGARERGEREQERAARAKVGVLLRGDEGWPASLRALSDEPDVLFVRGDPAVAREPAVAIVGTRECTAGGADRARRLAATLAEAGWSVVSGLARGIDTAAHRGALDSEGATIAVLGCGPDVAYPSENRALQEEIAATGLLVSEFAPGVEPRSKHFPRRNRILAALAGAVVVVESRLRSGALVTARHALDQGKEMFAIPGAPGTPEAAGPLQLLRHGARLIRHAEDLLDDLGAAPGAWSEVPSVAAGPGTAARPESVDALAMRLGVSPREAEERIARDELLRGDSR